MPRIRTGSRPCSGTFADPADAQPEHRDYFSIRRFDEAAPEPPAHSHSTYPPSLYSGSEYSTTSSYSHRHFMSRPDGMQQPGYGLSHAGLFGGYGGFGPSTPAYGQQPPGPGPVNQPGYGPNASSSSQGGFIPDSLHSSSHDTSESGLHRQDSSSSRHFKGEEQGDDEDGSGKRRRVQRACDVCRRKKVRCDGLQPGKNACTNCITYGQECKFEEAAKRRAPPRSYVEALEARMERMEKLLAELAPGIDFTDRVGHPIRLPEETKDKDGSPKGAPAFVKPAPLLEIAEPAVSLLPSDTAERDQMIARLGGKMNIRSEEEEEEANQDAYNTEEVAFVTACADQTDSDVELQVRICSNPSDPNEKEQQEEEDPPQSNGQAASFLGTSSAFHMIPALQKMGNKQNFTRQIKISGSTVSAPKAFSDMRPLYWKMPSCLTVSLFDEDDSKEIQRVRAIWPEPDLEQKLVDAFFAYPHSEYPILSESAFRAELKDSAKREDQDWLLLAMAVFAVGSGYCNDDRVFSPGETTIRGSRYYNTCRRIGIRRLWPLPSLSHVQALLLAVIYVVGTPLAQSVGWSLIGSIFRMLQYAGAHRKLTAARLRYPLALEEAWRRVWWTAYSLDREMATMFGRPAAVQDEDFDIDFPLELDDEILALGRNELGEIPKQPADKPARISVFVCGLKLDEIIGKTLRTIYAIGKAKESRGLVGKGWDQLIVVEIDSMLNQWLDNVPAHLRYNPDQPNQEWLVQSTMLYCKYYYCQILVHRPFVAGPKTNSSLNFPSLAITTNAARSTAQMLHNLCKRGLIDAGGALACCRAFEAGCVLLIVGWGAKRSGLRTSSGTISDIRKCLEVLATLERQWSIGGRLRDLLRILCSASDVDHFDWDIAEPQSKRKADVGGDGEVSMEDPQAGHGASASNDESRSVSGSHRVNRSRAAAKARESDGNVTLPLSTHDLGVTPMTDTSGGSNAASPGPSSAGAEGHSQAQDQDAQANASSSSSRQQAKSSRQKRFEESLAELTMPAYANGAAGRNLDPAFAAGEGGNGNPNASGHYQTFPNPLDLPTFSSALLLQGRPGVNPAFSFASNSSGATLTPGYPDLFAGSGLTPYFDPATNMPPQEQAAYHPGGDASSMGGMGGQGRQIPDMGGAMPQSQQHAQAQAQQQQQQPQPQQPVEMDSFTNVLQDLWAAQDFFSSDLGGAGAGSMPF